MVVETEFLPLLDRSLQTRFQSRSSGPPVALGKLPAKGLASLLIRIVDRAQ